MTPDLREGPLATAPAPGVPARKLSWREQRWLRRRRRIWFEEVLAWILVPIIVIGGFWLVTTILSAMGTSPSAIIDGLKTALQGLEKR
jgi:hypothetical protein